MHSQVLKNGDNEKFIQQIHKEVCALTKRFPLPNEE